MSKIFQYKLLIAVCAAVLISNVQAQTGLECLRCYSGVCDADTSQLSTLVTANSFRCCSCFQSLAANDCQTDTNSTINALEQQFSNASLDDCCDNVREIVTTESYENSTSGFGNTCGNQGSCFHSGQELAVEASDIDNSIGAGRYIVNHFRFGQNEYIRSISLRVFNAGQGNDDLTVTVYRTLVSRDVSFTSRLYEERVSFQVSLQQSGTPNILIATPIGADVLVSIGDTLGFTIAPMSTLIIGALQASDVSVQNITDYDNQHPCGADLDNLVEALPSSQFGLLDQFDPLLAVELGPLDTTSDPTEPTSTPPLTSQTMATTGPTEAPTVLPMYAIIAIGAGGGLCIVLLLVICIVCVCLCYRRRRRKTIVIKSHYKNGSGSRVVSTSQRIQDMSSSNVITVVNTDVDESHNYDTVPTEGPHFYHELIPTSSSTDSYKYTTMNPPYDEPTSALKGRLATTGQLEQLPSFAKGDPGVYNDPAELAGTPPRFSNIAPNPLYRPGDEANQGYNPPSHYDVPTALIRAQEPTPPPPPFYHELEGPTERKPQNDSRDNIYTETAFGLGDEIQSPDSVFGSKRSVRSSSVDTALTSDTARESTNSEAPLIPHYYHELENTDSPRASPRSPPIIRIEEGRPSLTDSLERSSGGHRVFEPGIYVPGGEERQHLAVIKGDTSEEYKTWKQKSYKASKNNKQFFEETVTFWEPKNAEAELYEQLSERKFREILREQIEFSSHLGVGQFGSVSKATWNNLQGGSKKVAVKTLKPTMKQDAKIAFLKEAAIMGQFCHSNVVMLYGVVTVGSPIMIVMELMALGDLDTYLYNNYRPGEMPPPQKKTLLSFSRQVACGMKYLARKNFVHRDLAARNVLVTETLVCKIGDFGMSRNLHDTNYYASRGGTVPIKWTAPEGLNYKKFSTASDVYSYGMVLYEIWSLGLKPLAQVKIQNVSQYVTEGNCQHPPPGCPRRMYEIMVHCWSPEQRDRPTFKEIFNILNGSDTELLSWSEEDQASLSNLAMELGAPLSETKTMFLDLQIRNLVREEKMELPGFLGTDV